MLLVSCSRLYAPRICFWSVTLDFIHQEYVSGQLLLALCTKNMFLVSCSRLYAPRICFWSVALGFMHQEYVSGQLLSALFTKNMFLVSCFRNVLLTFLVDISDKGEIKPCTNIHILDKIDPTNIVSLIVLPINASVWYFCISFVNNKPCLAEKQLTSQAGF